MRLLLCLSLVLGWAGPLACDGPPKIAFTFAGIAFAERDLIVTKKETYVHILLDLFPYQSRLKDGAKAYAPLAEALVTEVRQRQPEAKKFKVDLVEFKDRDEYDAPVWSSVKIVFHHDYSWPKPPKARQAVGEKKKPVK
jgi:hypothetical protein